MRHLFFITLIASALLSGCVTDNASIYVSGNVVVNAGDGACEFSAESGILRPFGVYNLSFPAPYTAIPIFNSTLRNRASDFRSDPNGVLLTNATVELQDSVGNPLNLGDTFPNPFSVPISVFVPSANTDAQPSSMAGTMDLVPNSYRGALTPFVGSTIVASVTTSGKTLGDIEVESSEWRYPIELCNGQCLFTCSMGDILGGNSCFPGQDQAVIVGADNPAFAAICSM